MLRLINTCALCVLNLLNNIDASRILVVVPTPSISHQLVFRPLTQELAKRGHDVTIITTDPAFPKGQTPENLTEIDVHDFSYREWRKILATFDNGEKNDIQKQIEQSTRAILKIFEEQTKVPEVQDIINNRNSTFDLLIVEAWLRFALGFAHAIKTPVIAMSSLGAALDNYDVIGAPVHPLVYLDPITIRVNNHSLLDKIAQYYDIFSVNHFWAKHETVENEVVKRIFGEDTPPLSQLQNNVDMLFLNIHPFWEGSRPVPPGVIYIGGLHLETPKQLPQDLKNYLDSSKNGVIYISFGTNVETSALPAEKVREIIKAFSQLPYDVLWKWNEDELPGRTKYIKISKWFPQSELLKHPKVKLFITQGGIQSTDEAIFAGVPLIGVPMIGDQWYNVEKYVHHKIGKRLELATMKAEKLKNAIETIIGDISYRENVVRVRKLICDQPMSSLERAVWWTEHVLRHGGARHLRAPAANMSWTRYYEMELVLVVLGVIVLSLALSVIMLLRVYKYIEGKVNNCRFDIKNK